MQDIVSAKRMEEIHHEIKDYVMTFVLFPNGAIGSPVPLHWDTIKDGGYAEELFRASHKAEVLCERALKHKFGTVVAWD